MNIEFLARGGVLLVAIIASLWDLETRRVPNWLTLPAMAVVGVWRVWAGPSSVFGIWLILFALWSVHIFGGGDAKLLMVFSAVFSEVTFIVWLCVVAVLAVIPLLLRKYRGTSPRVLFRRAWLRFWLGPWQPTKEELDQGGQPTTWILGLAAASYALFFWRIG